MAKGILLVQSRPSASDAVDAYNRWYDDVHIPEMLAVDGIVSARRMQARAGDSYLVIYELDDVEEAKASMADAQAAGRLTRPDGVQLDPPPSVHWFADMGGTAG